MLSRPLECDHGNRNELCARLFIASKKSHSIISDRRGIYSSTIWHAVEFSSYGRAPQNRTRFPGLIVLGRLGGSYRMVTRRSNPVFPELFVVSSPAAWAGGIEQSVFHFVGPKAANRFRFCLARHRPFRSVPAAAQRGRTICTLSQRSQIGSPQRLSATRRGGFQRPYVCPVGRRSARPRGRNQRLSARPGR